MGDRLSADNSFFSSAESIKSNGVLPSRLSRMTLLMILSILVYTLFSRMFDLMQPPVVKHSIAVA